MKLRSLIFWIHLASGVAAGAIILVMSLTDTAIAFEKELLAWHTGEALGLPGKTIASIASLGGAALVFTGLSLAIRRFLAWRQKPDSAGVPLQPAPELK